jgi:hypothetical protein
MILLTAILFILTEAITEGLLKRHSLCDFIFKGWMQWIIAIALFGIWFWFALNFGQFIPISKLILGFVFVRFMIFDPAYSLANGQKWDYYGTTKLYDRIMTKLADWGTFMKIVFGIVGIVFLMGWS